MIVDIALKKEVDHSYEIVIDALAQLTFDRKVAVVTNPKIAGLHLKYLLDHLRADGLYIITVPDGEMYKNQASIDAIVERLFDHRFNRNSLLIAFGGGVIGDMTGFAASIYQRGIDFIQIPTTLLSQVDASVGGKTGINNCYGKNLIGAFHQPQAVYIDPYFLKTLPQREFSAGIAEIIKMAVTFNNEFFEFLEQADLSEEQTLTRVLAQAVQTKAWVVSQDEKERGLRAALNYGHTFGHVIEKETHYKTYLHGEAVGIGMVMANRLALELGWMNDSQVHRITKLLEKYKIPTTYTITDVDAFYETFYLDKKSSDTTIKFILPRGIGNVEITDAIDEATVKGVLEGFVT